MAKAPRSAKPGLLKAGLRAIASAFGRMAGPITNSYDAAGQGRRMRGWQPPNTGPNRENSGTVPLRNRARDAGRNEWSAKSADIHWKANLVGTGIVPRPEGVTPAQKTAFVKLWDRWVDVSDADQVLNFYGQEAMVGGTWLESGEVFVRLRPRKMKDGLPVPLQIQVIEADLCPIFYNAFAPVSGNCIRQGIEFDPIGRRVAYWMYAEHPGDLLITTNPQAYLLTRVPAENILHIYEPTRPGQLRGVSDYAAILAKLKGMGDFDDAVGERQKIANLFTVFFRRHIEDGGSPSIDPITGQPLKPDYDGMPMAALEPGLAQEVYDTDDITFSNPPGPGADYADYMRVQSQHVAAGRALPFEYLTGDIANVSDRTLRVVIQEFRRICQMRQQHILIHQFCRPVREAFADAAVLAGVIPPSERDALAAVTWVPQAWPYIHPVQDVNADKIAVEEGFDSRENIITSRGRDPETVDAERADSIAREQQMGLEKVDNEPAPKPGAAPQAHAAPLQPERPQHPPSLAVHVNGAKPTAFTVARAADGSLQVTPNAESA
jgi:lambda family phage portal protein